MSDPLLTTLPPGRPLDWQFTPVQAIGLLPTDTCPQLLHSGRHHPRWARHSMIGLPAGFYRFSRQSTRAAYKSTWTPLATGHGKPAHQFTPPGFTHDPLGDLQAMLDLTRGKGLWIGSLSYDLGRWIEVLPEQAIDDRNWPVIELAWCPDVALYDLATSAWTWHGQSPPPGLEPVNTPGATSPSSEKLLSLAEPLKPTITREQYLHAARKVIDYIAAGDIFQANYAQRFTTRVIGAWPNGPRALFAKLATVSPAWYGAFLQSPLNHGLLSTSPELFLELDEDRTITTRPIKGTSPASEPAEKLRKSEKDTAELNMIVDLLRNDIGRVSSYGSVHVTQPREIESHPTVHHGVATIQGKLRPGLKTADLLRATMPGGSITGAPKVRAMQIIDELEPTRRGPYCGAIGWLTNTTLCLNIAIRTMLARKHDDHSFDIDFSVGGGIVADSTPENEYQETIDKAQAMLKALGIEKSSGEW
jgi:para-aminobenzoate synthetase component 1